MEEINRMKLCTLCLSNEEWPYEETGAVLHDRSGIHHTVGYYNDGKEHLMGSWKRSWQPGKGHPLYEQHVRSLKLLKANQDTV